MKPTRKIRFFQKPRDISCIRKKFWNKNYSISGFQKKCLLLFFSYLLGKCNHVRFKITFPHVTGLMKRNAVFWDFLILMNFVIRNILNLTSSRQPASIAFHSWEFFLLLWPHYSDTSHVQLCVFVCIFFFDWIVKGLLW